MPRTADIEASCVHNEIKMVQMTTSKGRGEPMQIAQPFIPANCQNLAHGLQTYKAPLFQDLQNDPNPAPQDRPHNLYPRQRPSSYISDDFGRVARG